MQTYFSSALPAISKEFASVDYYAWVHSSYILASSSVMLLSSSLCHRYGNRKSFIIGSLLFGAGTLLAPFSYSMLHLVLARIVMGIGAGVVVPATYGIIGEHFDRERYSAIFAAFAVVQILFNGLGSLAGGYLPSIASWQTIFYLLLPLEVISLILVLRMLPSCALLAASEPLPLRRHLLMMLAILLTTWGIEQVYHHDYVLLFCGVLLLIFMVRKDVQNGSVLLPKEFVNDPLLRNLCLQVFVLGAFFHVCLVYLPSVMQFSMGIHAELAGRLLSLFIVLMGIGSILGGWVKISARKAILMGWSAGLAGGILMPIFFTPAVGLLGFGSGMLMSTLLGYTAARTQGNASGVNSTAHLIRNFGGSMGTILFQFSLHGPQRYYQWGVLILTLSGAIVAVLAYRHKEATNAAEHDGCAVEGS
jgi:predicted MFS family arabinose efflux permease